LRKVDFRCFQGVFQSRRIDVLRAFPLRKSQSSLRRGCLEHPKAKTAALTILDIKAMTNRKGTRHADNLDETQGQIENAEERSKEMMMRKMQRDIEPSGFFFLVLKSMIVVCLFCESHKH
jgi:hypothetical protein